MIEKAFAGDRRYFGWLFFLLAIVGVGFVCYLWQLREGLTITGLSRDVSWGLYIAQFTFLVGVAASAVMLVLPYYLHHYEQFGRIMILGEFLAVSAVLMCMLFIFVDMGQPLRVLNVLLYPTLNSVMFWDMLVLSGYLLLNILIGWVTLDAEHKSIAPPNWVKPLIYISIPWAVSIHTVTAFLYAGLPGRHLWLTAIMAARFLSSAFASGPSLLIILCFIVRRVSRFDPGREPVQKLAQIVAYAMILNVFFVLLELFTTFYSGMPGHVEAFKYLYVGLDGHRTLVPWMWISALFACVSIILLVNPRTRSTDKLLGAAVVLVFVSTWIDKGVGLVVGGFIPNPLEGITEYRPTAPEVLITLGVWAFGFLVLTVLYKVAISVKKEIAI